MFTRINIFNKNQSLTILKKSFAFITPRSYKFTAVISSQHIHTSCNSKKHPTTAAEPFQFHSSTNHQHNYLQKTFMSSSSQSSSSSKKNVWLLLIGSSLAVGAGFMFMKKYSETTTETKTELIPPKVFVELPESIPYLIIGTGAAGHAASRAIRANEVFAKVLMVGEERHPPYMRPPLTKELWYQNDDEKVKNLIFRTYGGKERTIFFEKEGYFFEPKELESNEHGGTALALGLKVSKIDVDDQTVYFDNGQKIKYEKCLIATGGTPKNLEIFKNAPPPVSQKVLLFRTVEDFNKLNDLVHKVQSIVIVGGGFLGSELACALGKKSAELKSFKVIQVFPEKGNLGLVLPEYLSKFATEKIKQEGAEILAERKIHQASYDKTADKVLLTLDDNSEISADLVVVAVGLDANIDLAKASDLEVDPRLGGFLVNPELEARSNLWAAGDAACFYDVRLGRRRVEHHDHAVVSGRLAGMNMTGARKPYKHQSMIWSDIGPYIGFEAIGLIDSALPTVSVFAKLPNSSKPDTKIDDVKSQDSEKTDPNPQIKELTLEETSSKLNSLDDDEYGKGIVFYLKDDVVVGVLMWNVFSGMSVARQIIQESRKFDDYAEVAKLFHLFYKPEDEDDKDKTKEPDQTETKAKKEVGEGAGFYVGR